jgi:hypothetical protein
LPRRAAGSALAVTRRACPLQSSRAPQGWYALGAENGATDRQLMALYDWSSEKQANVYTAAANRKRLAAQAANLLAVNQAARQASECPGVKAVDLFGRGYSHFRLA